MEKEVIIICLIYIEKLIINSTFQLTPKNWKRITFIGLIIASKVINILLTLYLYIIDLG